MPAVDRTNDFLSIVSNLSAQAVPRSRPAHTRAPQASNVEATKCKERIHRAERDLDKLRKLQAQGGGVFDDDPAAEVDQLCASIQQDLAQIPIMVQAVSQSSRDPHSLGIVAALNSSAMKLTQDFATVLRERATQQSSKHQHRAVFTSSEGPHASFGGSSGLRARKGMRGQLHAGHDLWAQQTGCEDPVDDDSCVISLPTASQMQQQMQRPQQRMAEVEGVEKMMGELAKSFKQMTGLVAQQHDLLNSIDGNMDLAVDNVERAQTSLTKFLDGIKGNRALVIKTFGVLIAFGIFFMIFLR